MAAIGLLVLFVIINLIGIRWVDRANTGLTILKIVIPLLAVIVLVSTHFHPGNFTAGGGFFPKGLSIPKTLMTVIPEGGIVFAFTGFETSLCASGEVARPTRSIPRALGVAMLAVTLLYVAVQVVCQGILGPSLARSSAPLATPRRPRFRCGGCTPA